MSKSSRWKHRPEGSTWGDYGPDDELGRLNLLTPEKVRQGLAEAREGLNFCLSLPLDFPGGNVLNPRRYPPIVRPTIRGGKPGFLYRVDQEIPEAIDVGNDDLVVMHLQYSTQWDGLSHFGVMFDADGDGKPEPVFYNGFRAGEDIVGPSDVADAGPTANVNSLSTSNAKRLGVDKMAEKCMQGRAVMIDFEAHFGRERKMIGYDDLMRVMDKDKVEVTPGDMVCFHTGFAEAILEMGRKPDKHRLENACAGLDGRDDRLLKWVTDSKVVSLIADNYAVEAYPARPGSGAAAFLPLHVHCLVKLGVNLGEIWHLSPLAQWLRRHGRSHFLLTAPPLRLPGAVGSPTTPIATV